MSALATSLQAIQEKLELVLPFFVKPDPDAPLVDAARAGDVRAFDALVYRYQSRIAQFVQSRLDSSIDSDDVAQDVFFTAWRELAKFQQRSRFKTWLFGIALNRCAEAARKHLRLKQALGDVGEQPREWAEEPPELDPVEWSLAEAEREAIRSRLAQLADTERQVLELYYYAELNLREISQLTGVNLSTVKYRFYQAHHRLRERLQEDPTSVLRVDCEGGRK